MAFTSGNDLNWIQPTDTAIMGAGLGDDRYVLDREVLTDPNQSIIISDTDGTNVIHLTGGLTIASSMVNQNTIRLTLSNGVEITIAGADTFEYWTGGTAGGGTGALAETFSEFVIESLGLPSVPTSSTPINGGTVTVNPTGGTDPFDVGDPTIIANQTEVDEGGTASFTVTGGENAAVGDIVHYTIGGDIDANDIVGGALSGFVTLAANLSADIAIELIEDNTLEGDESLIVTLDQGTANASTVVKDTSFPLVFELSSDAPIDGVLEGEETVFTVTSSKPVTDDTDVIFKVLVGDANANNAGTNNTNLNDFTAGTFNPITVTILAGDTTATYAVTGSNDPITELPEAYSVTAEVAGKTLTQDVTLLDGAGTLYLTEYYYDEIKGTLFDDTIIGNNLTLNGYDTIDGSDGIDTFRIDDLSLLGTAIPSTVTVTNVEQVVARSVGIADVDIASWTGVELLSSTSRGGGIVSAAATTDIMVTEADLMADNGVAASPFTNNLKVNGGHDVSVMSTQVITGGTIVVGDTTPASGSVFVTSSTENARGMTLADITITGGTHISSVQTILAGNGNPVTNASGTVNVKTSSTTTDVSVSATVADTGIRNNTVTINDVNNIPGGIGTLTDVSVDAYTTLALNASAVSTLTLAHGSGDVSISNTLAVVAPETTLALGLNAVTDTTIRDNGIYKIFNVTTSGAASILDNMATQAVTDLNIAGNQALTLTSAAGLTGLTTIKITESASLSANVFALPVASIDASTSSGDNTLTIDGAEANLVVKGGSGDDSLTVMNILAATAAITLGAGDDTYVFELAAAPGSTVDAGTGNDTIAIKNGGWLNADAANIYSHFETLEIAGGQGSYDLSLLGLTDLRLTDTPLSGATTITNGTADTLFTVSYSSGFNNIGDMNTGHALTYTLDANDTSDDSLSLVLNAEDTSINQSAEGQVSITMTANDVESIHIESNATTASDTLTEADYINTATISSSTASTVYLTGDAQAGFTVGAGSVVTLVDATGNTAGTTVNVSTAIGGSVSLNGSAGVDIYIASNHGDTIQGNAGADDISLGGGADALRYIDATDSQVIFTDTNSDGKADEATGYDTAGDFAIGSDIIELSSLLGLATGDARSDVLQKGEIPAATATTPEAAALEAFIGDGIDFFNAGLVDRAVAVANDANETFIFVDANSDGNFSAADDMMIALTGNTPIPITIADISFG